VGDIELRDFSDTMWIWVW